MSFSLKKVEKKFVNTKKGSIFAFANELRAFLDCIGGK
jgi:hypothetical protein